MYKLTEFTTQELRLLSASLNREIVLTDGWIKKADQYCPKVILDDVTREDRKNIATLRDIHVRVLTALQMKPAVETVGQN
jgi:hypothetical protein